MFVGRPGAYYRVDHLRDSSIGKALALLTMIRLGWNFQPGTNTLDYYKYLEKNVHKKFYKLWPRSKLIHYCTKLERLSLTANHFHPRLMFVDKVRASPSGAPYWIVTVGS
jgi:hypothetical protein